ncbi:MAG TPA: methyltransferase domain-containing protein [Paracoccaceae bacterium]|nr:methyltransferase domain-containing protein [Paracoccaceae bacterium]
MKREIQRRIFSLYSFFAALPFVVRKYKVAPPRLVSHAKWADYLEAEFNHPGVKVLEIGSRVVTGSNFRGRFSRASYVGFDFYAGENVDVVGDAHRLTSYFDEGEKFDLIFSSAVFEHLHMPWVVAEEIAKLLNVGGHVFVETHFSFVAHERPWNFFQFSEMGLRALFNSGLGFDLIDYGMSNPIGGYFSRQSDRSLRYRPVRELYCHSEILCRKREEVTDFDWRSLELDGVVDGTRYPPPRS